MVGEFLQALNARGLRGCTCTVTTARVNNQNDDDFEDGIIERNNIAEVQEIFHTFHIYFNVRNSNNYATYKIRNLTQEKLERLMIIIDASLQLLA